MAWYGLRVTEPIRVKLNDLLINYHVDHFALIMLISIIMMIEFHELNNKLLQITY